MEHEQEERKTGGPGLQVGGIIQFLALALLTDLTYYYFFRLYRSGMLDNQGQGRFRTQVAALEPVPPSKSPSEYTVINREHERLLFSLGAAGEAVYSVGQNCCLVAASLESFRPTYIFPTFAVPVFVYRLASIPIKSGSGLVGAGGAGLAGSRW